MKQFKLLSLTTLLLCITVTVNAQTKSDTQKEPVKIKLSGVPSVGKEPLYIVDGKVLSTPLNDLDPNQIEAIEVLKNAASLALYGPEAQNGVILITTKKAATKVITNGGNGTRIILRGKSTTGKTPIYILDGEITTDVDIQALDPNKIEAIEVLKNASAVTLYGPEAINGVIVITTKKEVPTVIKK